MAFALGASYWSLHTPHCQKLTGFVSPSLKAYFSEEPCYLNLASQHITTTTKPAVLPLTSPLSSLDSSHLEGDDPSLSSTVDITYPNYLRYSWTITQPSLSAAKEVDISQLADCLLELGCAAAAVVPSSPVDVSDDENFSKTGRLDLRREEGTNSIEFWMMEMDDGDGDDAHGDDCANGRARELALIAAKHAGLDGISGDVKRLELDDGASSSSHEAVDAYLPAEDESSPIKIIDINGTEISICSYVDDDVNGGSCWAFGDGNHPSTSLSLRGLQEFVSLDRGGSIDDEPFSFLDYGCGSGILTLAAIALGAGTNIVAVDVSLDALRLTRENLARNDVPVETTVDVRQSMEDEDETCPGEGDDWRGSFDAVVANIPSNTLVGLLPTLASALRRGEGKGIKPGKLMTAGYPASEIETLTKAVKQLGLTEEESRRLYDSGWVLQVFRHDET